MIRKSNCIKAAVGRMRYCGFWQSLDVDWRASCEDGDLKALLGPYEGELAMREQDGPKPNGDEPLKPKKQKPDPQPRLF